MAKKRNPQDTTLRNLRAAKKGNALLMRALKENASAMGRHSAMMRAMIDIYAQYYGYKLVKIKGRK